MSEQSEFPSHQEAPEQLSDLAANSLLNQPTDILAKPYTQYGADQLKKLESRVIKEDLESRN